MGSLRAGIEARLSIFLSFLKQKENPIVGTDPVRVDSLYCFELKDGAIFFVSKNGELGEKWDRTHFARLIELESLKANKWTASVRGRESDSTFY